MTKSIKNKWLAALFCAMAAFILLGTFFAVQVRALTKVETKASVGLGFSYDFSVLEENSTDWQKYVYEAEGVMISPITPIALCLEGGFEPTIYAQGSITYRVEAQDQKVFSALKMHFTGRVFHFQHPGTCQDCYMNIFVGEEGSDLQLVKRVSAVESGDSQLMTFDLLEGRESLGTCLVRIELAGYGGGWVNMEKIAFSGAESEADGSGNNVVFEEGENDLSVVSQNSVVQVRSVRTEGEGLSGVTPTVEITYPSGQKQQGTSFTASETGRYLISCRAEKDGRTYADEYEIYCVPDAQANWSGESSLLAANYCSEDGSVEETSDGVKIVGNAGYLLPVDFSDRFSLSFSLKELQDRQSAEIAVTGKPGPATFDTMENPGLYFILKYYQGKLMVTGYFSDGESVISLVADVSRDIDGKHTISLLRRFDSYSDGTIVYVDADMYSAYLATTAVKLSTFLNEDRAFVAFRAVNTEMTVHNVRQTDAKYPSMTPNINNEEAFPDEGYVGDCYRLPAVSMVDEVDGAVSYELTVTDYTGAEVEVYTKTDPQTQEEYQAFDLVYSERYMIRYFTRDNSGNEFTYTKRVTARLKEGAPRLVFSEEPPRTGRQYRDFDLPLPESVTNGNLSDVKVTVVTPNGQSVEAECGGTYRPMRIGDYQIIYTMTNDVATTTILFVCNVKIDVDAADSYTDFTDLETWHSAGKVLEKEGDGLAFYGNAYCSLPFEMTSGIEVTLDISSLVDKNVSDCWVGLRFGNLAAYGSYDNPASDGLYFMVFRVDGQVYYNVATKTGGQFIGMFGDMLLGQTDTVTISVEELRGSSIYYDNVNVYINHTKLYNNMIYSAKYSDLVDDENFTYLTVAAYGPEQNAQETKKATITSIGICDQVAPEVILDGAFPEEGIVGTSLKIPAVSVQDNLDTEFYCSIGFYGPDGKSVDISSGEFIPQTAGRYYLVVKASDLTGNQTLVIKELNVTGKGGCSSSVNGTASLWVIAICMSIALIWKSGGENVRKKRRY